HILGERIVGETSGAHLTYRTARVIQITLGNRANIETAHGRVPAGVIKAHCPTAFSQFPGTINRYRRKAASTTNTL
ncbi:Hypothetical predicted protein, partial [Paramuricea clavata]